MECASWAFIDKVTGNREQAEPLPAEWLREPETQTENGKLQKHSAADKRSAASRKQKNKPETQRKGGCGGTQRKIQRKQKANNKPKPTPRENREVRKNLPSAASRNQNPLNHGGHRGRGRKATWAWKKTLYLLPFNFGNYGDYGNPRKGAGNH